MLLLDNEIQKRGQAYTNYSGLFYPIPSDINGLYTYSAPYKQLCNDTSISGANVMSGVYLNGHFVTVGQSGLVGINHYQGALYFNQNLPKNTVISGNYAVKDFSIELTDQPESKLLFETKYWSFANNITPLSGLTLDIRTSPAIFLRTKYGENVPFALGGMDDRTKKIRAVVIADNEYQRSAVCGIMQNMAYTPFYLANSIPMDQLGNMTGINYNFKNINFDAGTFPWIMKVKITDAPRHAQFKDVWKNTALVDFEISTIYKHV